MTRFFLIIMCNFILCSVSIAFSFVAFTAPAYAQTNTLNPVVKPTDYRQSFRATPFFNHMAAKAVNRPLRFDFMEFRSLYSRTHQYDPIGDQALKTLNDLAFIVLNDQDPERVETALFGFHAMVNDHLAHIGVIMQALSLSRTDKRFGDITFYEWLRDGLIKTVMISGDGYSLKGAYDVITIAEETILFNRLGLKQLKTRTGKEGIVYYNLHDAQDPASGEERMLIVNTSIPMKYLEALKEEQEGIRVIDIGRQ